MPNFWTLTLCCFFVGHKKPDLHFDLNCSRCGITEIYLKTMKSRWLSFLCVGPKCFLRGISFYSKKYVGNLLCKYIGHRIKESWRYHGKLCIEEATMIAIGENAESRTVNYGVEVDVTKRCKQLMDDGYYQRVMFCERCLKRFDKHSGER